MLSDQQKIQENEYALPYHWFKDRGTFGGRVYFGYQDICLDFIKENSPDIHILDAGCGDGRLLGELKKRGFSNLCGIDYSERAVSFARILLPSADIKVGDLADLPYQDNYFDVVYIIETLEHIIPENIPIIIKNFNRVLKPGGKLIITVPSKNMPLLSKSKHYQHFTIDSLSAYLKQEFDIKEIVGQNKAQGSLLFNLIYSLLDNRFWDIKMLRIKYNLTLWPKLFNKCETAEAGRLIAFCQKREDAV